VAASPVWEPVAVSMEPVAGLGPGRVSTDPAVAGWESGKRTLRVAAADHRRLLVVHENSNPGWRAELAGHVLRPVVVDGWQQGYLVPPGLAGTVRLEHAGAQPYRLGLGVGLLLALAVVFGAALTPSGSGLAVLPAARPGTWLRAGLSSAAGLALAGWPGLVIIVVSVAALRRLGGGGTTPSRRGLASSIAVGVVLAAVAAAGAMAAVRPWGDPAGYLGSGAVVASLTTAAVLAVLVGWAGLGSGTRRDSVPTRPSRHVMAGRSTTR
jgi:arabinofuranan 3-O-arabinosyltransferase